MAYFYRDQNLTWGQNQRSKFKSSTNFVTVHARKKQMALRDSTPHFTLEKPLFENVTLTRGDMSRSKVTKLTQFRKRASQLNKNGTIAFPIKFWSR